MNYKIIKKIKFQDLKIGDDFVFETKNHPYYISYKGSTAKNFQYTSHLNNRRYSVSEYGRTVNKKVNLILFYNENTHI